jgi:hypothetical protein
MKDAQRIHGAKGGRRGVATRVAKYDQLYRTAAMEMIADIRSKHPTLSDSKVADEVLARWKNEDPPSHRTLTRLIAHMKKDR